MSLPHPERVDVVNDNLTLTQYTDGLTFGTDALLLAAYIRRHPKAEAIEFGGGTGIISLLLATRKKLGHITCVEIQKDFADLIALNIRNNNCEDRVTAVCTDIREPTTYADGECDIVFTNPPYMRADGIACQTDAKQIARHAVMGDIGDFVSAAAKKLKWGGKFYCVWRPDRLTELIAALAASKIEPKRMTFVQATPASAPSMVLIEAHRGGKPGMWVTQPLIIGSNLSERADSPDMCYILEKGCFPKHYEKR